MMMKGAAMKYLGAAAIVLAAVYLGWGVWSFPNSDSLLVASGLNLVAGAIFLHGS